MRTSLTAVSLLVLSATSALANPPYDPDHSWQGFYVGLYGSRAWGESEFQPIDLAGPFPTTFTEESSRSPDLDGTLIGFQSGYNWQRGNLVFGYVSDTGVLLGSGDSYDWTQEIFFEPKSFTTTKASLRTDLRYLSTLRARGGFLLKQGLLAYGTVGGAMGMFKTTFSSGPFSESKKHTEFGLAYGGGLEYALSDSVTVQMEYLHVNFDDVSVSFSDGPDADFDYDLDQLRLGLTMKFNGFHGLVETLR